MRCCRIRWLHSGQKKASCWCRALCTRRALTCPVPVNHCPRTSFTLGGPLCPVLGDFLGYVEGPGVPARPYDGSCVAVPTGDADAPDASDRGNWECLDGDSGVNELVEHCLIRGLCGDFLGFERGLLTLVLSACVLFLLGAGPLLRSVASPLFCRGSGQPSAPDQEEVLEPVTQGPCPVLGRVPHRLPEQVCRVGGEGRLLGDAGVDRGQDDAVVTVGMRGHPDRKDAVVKVRLRAFLPLPRRLFGELDLEVDALAGRSPGRRPPIAAQDRDVPGPPASRGCAR